MQATKLAPKLEGSAITKLSRLRTRRRILRKKIAEKTQKLEITVPENYSELRRYRQALGAKRNSIRRMQKTLSEVETNIIAIGGGQALDENL